MLEKVRDQDLVVGGEGGKRTDNYFFGSFLARYDTLHMWTGYYLRFLPLISPFL